MRFLHPRSSIPHLCVLETDNTRDQVTKYPGLLYHHIPAFHKPLDPFISSNLPHTIKPSIKPPTYQHIGTTQCHYVVAVVSSSAKINRLHPPEILRSCASRPSTTATRHLASICLSGLWTLDSVSKKTQVCMSNIIKFPPEHALGRPVSALQ